MRSWKKNAGQAIIFGIDFVGLGEIGPYKGNQKLLKVDQIKS
jgi:hypothetical protein